jgi:CubicO group peptidase (beta-lactamase class C family)
MAMVSVSVGQAQSREQVGTAIARAVDSLAAVAVRDGLTPALGVAVVMDGRTIYKKEHGMADSRRSRRSSTWTPTCPFRRARPI